MDNINLMILNYLAIRLMLGSMTKGFLLEVKGHALHEHFQAGQQDFLPLMRQSSHNLTSGQISNFNSSTFNSTWVSSGSICNITGGLPVIWHISETLSAVFFMFLNSGCVFLLFL